MARAVRMAPEDRRMEILSAARSLFLEYGFEGVSMGQIAASAGISRPAVYRYFSSPTAIWDGLFEDELTHCLAECRPLLEGTQPSPSRLRSVLRHISQHRELIALLHSGGSRAFQQHRRQLLEERLLPLLTRYSSPVRVGPYDTTILLTVLMETAWWSAEGALLDSEVFLDNVVAWIYAASHPEEPLPEKDSESGR